MPGFKGADDKCKTCVFSLSIPGGAHAVACRRYPPTAFVVGMQPSSNVVDPKNPAGNMMPVVRGFFPVHGEEDWCGEFSPKVDGSA